MLVTEDGFAEWYGAVTAVAKLTTSVTHSPELVDGNMVQRLRLMLDSDLTQGPKRSEGKDLLYEHEVAYWLSRLGLRVQLAEPDVLVSCGGLSATVGIACKYPSSARQVLKEIRKGYDQVAKRGLPGIVAIGLDQLALGSTLRPQVCFSNEEDARAAMLGCLKNWVNSVVKRAAKQHSPPMEPVLYTLNVVVGIANRHCLTFEHASHIHADSLSDPTISAFMSTIVERSQLQFVGSEADDK